MSAIPYYFNYDLAEMAVEAGVHFCDLGGNTEIVFQQKELDGEARARADAGQGMRLRALGSAERKDAEIEGGGKREGRVQQGAQQGGDVGP